MIAPRMAGLICCHSAASALVTVTKSVPKKTPVTPSAAKMRLAKGDFTAASALGKSAVPISSTVWPGRNFSVAGLGVLSVWMNISYLLPFQSDMRPVPPGVKVRPGSFGPGSASVRPKIGIHLVQRARSRACDAGRGFGPSLGVGASRLGAAGLG